jgi:hypothetical protein
MKKITAVIAAIAVVVIVVIAAFTLMPQQVSGKLVYWTTVPPGQQQAAIASGQVQGGVSWEPYVSDSILAGTGTAVVWSGDVWPGHPCCVLVVRDGFNADLTARVLKADVEAANWMNDALAHKGTANYSLLMEMGAQFSNRNVSVVENATLHVKYGTDISTQEVRDGITMFTYDFISLAQTSNDTIHARGYANVTAFVNDFIDTSVAQTAASIQPSAVILNPTSPVHIGYLAGDLHQFARVVAMNTTIWGGQTAFEKYGVKVDTPNIGGYLSGGDEMTAFAGGLLDMGYLGAPPAILKSLNLDYKIHAIALVNSEGSAIVAKTGITSFDGLNGMIIATPGPASIQHLLLLEYAKAHGYMVKPSGT